MSLIDEAIREVRALGARDAQNLREAQEFIEFFADKKIKGYIEVGTRHGWTFYLVAKVLRPKWMIAIDLPAVPPWGDAGSDQVLNKVVDKVRDMGIDVNMIFGPSGDWATLAQVEHILKKRKADLIFIDGDHRYQPCMTDWCNYWPNAKRYLAFHDTHTRKGGVEVIDVWSRIKADTAETADNKYRFHEINHGMGVGIVER